MQKRFRVYYLVAILPIIIWMLSFGVPVIEEWLKKLETTTLIMNLFGLLNILIVALVAFLHIDNEERNVALKDILKVLDSSKQIPLANVYSELNRHLAVASRTVDITSFRDSRPTVALDGDAYRFYDSLLKYCTSHTNISFRIIIKDTDANAKWIDYLVKLGKNKQNVSIRKINNIHPLLPSVQLFDSKYLYIMGINDNGHRTKDLHIDSNNIGESFQNYYNKLWEQSIPLLGNGNIV